MRNTKGIQQISLAAAISAKGPISPQQIDQATRAQERKTYQASLESSAQTERSSLVSSYSFSPHPLLLSQQQLLQLKQFNEALSIAITNIVERWWTDKQAGLPLRMPLGPREDSLLQVQYSVVFLDGWNTDIYQVGGEGNWREADGTL